MAKLGKNIGKPSSEEKLLMYYYKTTEYYQANKNRVYTIGLIVLAVIAAVFIFFKNKESKNETATLELGKVKNTYFSGSYQQAIYGDSLGQSRGLQYIVDNYGSTESGESAKILLANSYYYLRNFDMADKYYKDYAGKNEILKASAFAGIASVCEAKNDYVNAAKNYEKASEQSKIVANNDEYLFFAIRNYYQVNDKENIKRVAKELKTDYPKSKLLAQLNRYDSGD